MQRKKKQFIQCFAIAYKRHYAREVCIHKHQKMCLEWWCISTIWHGCQLTWIWSNCKSETSGMLWRIFNIIINTVCITSSQSQNTTKFIALYCTICFTTTCFSPFFRPSSGCISLALGVLYHDNKVILFWWWDLDHHNFSLIMAGV